MGTPVISTPNSLGGRRLCFLEASTPKGGEVVEVADWPAAPAADGSKEVEGLARRLFDPAVPGGRGPRLESQQPQKNRPQPWPAPG